MKNSVEENQIILFYQKSWQFLPRFAIVFAGVTTGFALLTAIALQNTPAFYGAIITRLVPLATALYSTRLFH